MHDLTPLIYTAGGCLVGILAMRIRYARRDRSAYRAGHRDCDRLWTARIAQDRRDDAPLCNPVSRQG